MKTNIIIVLDTRVKKANGTYPLILRIVHERKSSQIPLGMFLLPKDWDDTQHLIKSSYKGTESVTRLNNQLQKKKAEALDIIGKLDENKTLQSLSVIQIKELIEKKSSKLSFFKYTENLITEMEKANRIGTARSYKGVVSVLRTYCKNRELNFAELNYDFLVKFENYHIGNGNGINGLAVYLRTIRAVYNSAIKANIVERDLYPFLNYKIKTKKTRKRAINLEAIRRIEELKLSKKHVLFNARNYFLISFYLRGMSFADLAQLKYVNMVDGRIHYQRRKTDKPYNVRITPQIQKMLNVYISSDGAKDDFIFPIITKQEPKAQYKSVVDARKRFNKKLKDLANLCNIEENLTSYVSRHSFATQAKKLGVPIATISDMLGHENTKTTEIYLDSLPDDIMDDFHEKIIDTTKVKLKKNK